MFEPNRFDEAIQKIAIAGREMGSGPAVAVNSLFKNNTKQFEALFGDKHELIAYGIAIGLIACNDPEANLVLERINKEWLENRNE